MPQIVTLTLNPCVDKTCSIQQVVVERKLRAEKPTYHPGGGGINVARAVTGLGGNCTAYWTCGGVMGELLRKLLDEESIDHEPVPIEDMTRENLIVHERSSEKQYRFGMPGARLSAEEVQACVERLEQIDPPPDYLVLSGSLPPGVDNNLYARIADSMPMNCRVILDSTGDPLKRGLESSVYLVNPNIHELEQLADRSIESDDQVRDVARSLIDSEKAQVVVTSLGSGGAMLTTADEHEHIRTPTVKIRSKVGAGDSMVAGIVFALSEGRRVVDAVHYGVAAGAAAVMTAGSELCRREDTERLFNPMIKSSHYVTEKHRHG